MLAVRNVLPLFGLNEVTCTTLLSLLAGIKNSSLVRSTRKLSFMMSWLPSATTIFRLSFSMRFGVIRSYHLSLLA